MLTFLAIAAAVILTWGCTAAAVIAFMIGCSRNWEAERVGTAAAAEMENH